MTKFGAPISKQTTRVNEDGVKLDNSDNMIKHDDGKVIWQIITCMYYYFMTWWYKNIKLQTDKSD